MIIFRYGLPIKEPFIKILNFWQASIQPNFQVLKFSMVNAKRILIFIYTFLIFNFGVRLKYVVVSNNAYGIFLFAWRNWLAVYTHCVYSGYNNEFNHNKGNIFKNYFHSFGISMKWKNKQNILVWCKI